MAVETSTVQVVMPAMGDSVAEGTVLEWRKQEGDQVEAEETVVEISTDKVDVELPAPASGPITEILVDEGATVTVGQVIARMTAGGPPPAPQTSAPESGVSHREEAQVAPAAGDGDTVANASPIA